MEVKVYLPTPLRQYADGQEVVVISASTVGEALQQLVERFQALRRHLYNESGKLRSFVNVFVNEEDIRHLKGEETPLKDGDTVYIIPSIAGGVGA
ncbi:MAG: MoaD/ThiS family protein [Aigarchaeota archaeon]|nr:MoaD/ThiS family protein [Candidatus Pelearchaeum maunauluense]